MQWRQLSDYLLPGEAERDPDFRREILRLAASGLRVLGAVEIAGAVLTLIAQFLLEPAGELSFAGAVQAAAATAIGVLTIAGGALPAGRRNPRFLAMCSALLAALILIVSSLVLTPGNITDDHYVAGEIAVVFLATVGAMPLRPMQTLSLGLAIAIFYFSSGLASQVMLPAAMGGDRSQQVTIVLLALLSTGLSALFYDQRRSTFEANCEALRTTGQLATAQSRALLSESAISVGRLAAALTHEINTPLGALKSAADTMLVISGKQASASPTEQRRLMALQAELRRSVRTSADRLSRVIARLQRFVEMEDNQRQTVNLNELLNDVGMMLQSRVKPGVRLDFELQPVPPLTCRPQQLSAVFSNLVSNALHAVDSEGRVLVSTAARNGNVEVTIRDSGRGMTAEELATIFHPGFKVIDGRVSTGNWSLFSTRQIVHEHGGEIKIESHPGEGTSALVSLPLSFQTANQ